jgi:hypothetical protein
MSLLGSFEDLNETRSVRRRLRRTAIASVSDQEGKEKVDNGA